MNGVAAGEGCAAVLQRLAQLANSFSESRYSLEPLAPGLARLEISAGSGGVATPGAVNAGLDERVFVDDVAKVLGHAGKLQFLDHLRKGPETVHSKDRQA